MSEVCNHEFSVRHEHHSSCKCGKKQSHHFGWVKPKTKLTIVSQFGDSGEIIVTVILPVIDLRPFCSPVRNQGSQGSCTGFSSSSAVTFLRMKQKEITTPPNLSDVASPAFIYASTRIAEGTFPKDLGASIADTVGTIKNLGSAPEHDMPYNENIYNQNPSPIAYNDALKIHGVNASVIYGNDVDLIDAALSNGYTVLIGVSVYSSFETEQTRQTGIIPIPDTTKEYLLGGHAVEIIGKKPDPSDSSKRMYNFKNSWGTIWGDKGYGYFYEDYLKNPKLSDDWHVLKLMT